MQQPLITAIRHIDFTLLRLQKLHLAEIAAESEDISSDQRASIDGTLQLLDELMDLFVSTGIVTELEVFGKERETIYEVIDGPGCTAEGCDNPNAQYIGLIGKSIALHPIFHGILNTRAPAAQPEPSFIHPELQSDWNTGEFSEEEIYTYEIKLWGHGGVDLTKFNEDNEPIENYELNIYPATVGDPSFHYDYDHLREATADRETFISKVMSNKE